MTARRASRRAAPIITLMLGAVLATIMHAIGWAADGDDCQFRKLEIADTQAPQHAHYRAAGKTIALEFASDLGRDTDVFPDPPTIRNLQSNTSCDLPADGIWVRKHVYLTDDERRVLADVYSGSWEALVVYDTATCSKLGEFALERRLLELQRNSLSLEIDCPRGSKARAACQKTIPIRFDKLCVPGGK
jgi:hypothetical protein